MRRITSTLIVVVLFLVGISACGKKGDPKPIPAMSFTASIEEKR